MIKKKARAANLSEMADLVSYMRQKCSRTSLMHAGSLFQEDSMMSHKSFGGRGEDSFMSLKSRRSSVSAWAHRFLHAFPVS